jgi:hypothetical protein
MPAKMTWRGRLPHSRDIAEPVHDGDTLWLETDQGDWTRKVRACRLLDVFAPELHELGGPECRRFAVAWVYRWNRNVDWPFSVDTILNGNSRDVTTFGRFVTVVWNADRTSQLNAEIQAFITTNNYPGGTGS